MPEPRQGKCVGCKVRWVWKGKPLVRDAACGVCGSPLEQTTYRLKYPVRDDVHPITFKRPDVSEETT